MKHEILEKIYAGLIGMDAGMRLGAPVENPYWNYESIREYYGDIRGYLRPHIYHTADDDVNGPIIFLRGLTDNGIDNPLTPEVMGETWLNYTRRGKGMFWWGGEEQSTEHRAYMNLKRGMKAPESGSIASNGKDMAEQIGGQIFIDTWGLIFSGNPHKAAEYARIAASVSHDGSGLDGSAFCAACSAAAFGAKSVEEIIDAGLKEIPKDCAYADVVDKVRKFHKTHPDDFRACRDYIENNFENPLGYHIIPNAGICILAMLYGGGDLGRSIEISVMCGFDTDCNASTIGTILGVFNGLDGIPKRYRKPINDNVIISSVSGYLNSVDLADYAKELYEIACKLQGKEFPSDVNRPKPGEKWLDFSLPGSTHCVEMSDYNNHSIRQVDVDGGCLEILIDGKRPRPADVFLKGMYAYRDLNDDRYEPVFSPQVYGGQKVTCKMKCDMIAPGYAYITPFLTCMSNDRRVNFERHTLTNEWREITFAIPGLGGEFVHNFGWNIELENREEWIVDKVLIKDIRIYGPMDYEISWDKQREEFGQVTPLSFNECKGELSGNRLELARVKDELTDTGQAFTGNYYMRESYVEGAVNVASGKSAMLILRGQGTRRYYALGLCGKNRVRIIKYNCGIKTILGTKAFIWELGRDYELSASAYKNRLSLMVNGEEILTVRDDDFQYGMVGLALEGTGKIMVGDLYVKGCC